MLLNFKGERLLAGTGDFDRFEDFWDSAFGEFHVHHTAQDLYDTAS